MTSRVRLLATVGKLHDSLRTARRADPLDRPCGRLYEPAGGKITGLFGVHINGDTNTVVNAYRHDRIGKAP